MRQTALVALAVAAAATTAAAQMTPTTGPMVPTQTPLQTGAGVASALAGAANGAGGIVTSPVGSANLAAGAAAANLGAPTGWLFGNGAGNPTGYSAIPGANVTFTPPGQSPETLQARALFQTFAGDYGASGSAQQTSGAIASGATTLTLASALDFANGQGVMVVGAGPAFAAAQPALTAAAVTYSAATAAAAWSASATSLTLAAACPTIVAGQPIYDTTNGANLGTAVSCSGTTLTFLVNPAGGHASTGAADGLSLPTASTGSTTYRYKVASLDGAGGVGIPVLATVTTGAATLNGRNYVALNVTPGSGATAYAIWKQIGAGSWYYLGSGQATAYVDTGLMSQDQSPGCTATQCGPYRPWWIPAAPPSTAQSDWLVGKITSGAGTTSLTLATAASTAVSGAIVWHDDTAALNACVNSGGSSANGAGAACTLPPGVYRTSGPIAFAYGHAGLVGARKIAVTIAPSGTSDDISMTTNANFLRDLYFLDTAGKAAGWGLSAAGGSQLDVQHVQWDHPYSGIRLMNWNNWTFAHLIVDRFFSQQGSAVAMVTDAAGVTCCGDMTDVYGYSAGTLGDLSTGQAGFLHDGNVQTVICRNCAVSDMAGSGLVTRDTVGGAAYNPQFLYYVDFSSEYATGRNADLLSGIHLQFFNPTLHTGGDGNFLSCSGSNALHIGPNVLNWQLTNGYIQNASGSGAFLEGSQGQIIGAQTLWNSAPNTGGTAGACPGVEFGPASTYEAYFGGTIGDTLNPTWQSNAVTLDVGAANNTVVGNRYGGNAAQTTVDNSGVSSNQIGWNAGDTSPAVTFNSGVLGVGQGATLASNNNYPGLSIREQNNGSAVQLTVNNTGSGNAIADVQLADTGFANVSALIGLYAQSGVSPVYALGINTGVTGGVRVDASGGGTSAPLTLKGGTAAGVTVAPFAQFASSYTVASLPACNAALAGGLAYVTDALAPSYNAALTGGGAVKALALCNGTAWTAH